MCLFDVNVHSGIGYHELWIGNPECGLSANQPVTNLSFCVPPSLSSSLPHLPDPHSLGQRGEPGAGAPSNEQSFGRGLGPQADPRPLYRDLCAGHQQPGCSGPGSRVHAGLPSLGPRCEYIPSRGECSTTSSPPSSWGDPRQDAAPVPGPWQHHTAPPPPTQQHQPQRQPAVQTQGPQRGAIPAEPWQDTHANVLPASLCRTHTRSHWCKPQYIHIEGGAAIWIWIQVRMGLLSRSQNTTVQSTIFYHRLWRDVKRWGLGYFFFSCTQV